MLAWLTFQGFCVSSSTHAGRKVNSPTTTTVSQDEGVHKYFVHNPLNDSFTAPIHGRHFDVCTYLDVVKPIAALYWYPIWFGLGFRVRTTGILYWWPLLVSYTGILNGLEGQ